MVAPAVVDVVLVVLVVVVVVVVVIVLVYGMLCGTKPKDSCPSNNSTVVGNNSTIIVGIVVTTLCARTNQHKSVGVCQPLASMQRVNLHTMKVRAAILKLSGRVLNDVIAVDEEKLGRCRTNSLGCIQYNVLFTFS